MQVADSRTQPFDSIRSYVEALDRRGRLLRIESMDQDQYEMSGFAYRLLDRYGPEDAPAFMVERVRIGGQWRDGPVLANLYGSWPDEALLFGVTDISDDQHRMYKAVIDALLERLDDAGLWKRIPPVEVGASEAPCKEVVLTGEQIDIEAFPWLQNNPADAGRYINMGSVFIQDPELGSNVGTYRCQVKGPRRIGVNPEPGQHGWLLLNEMKRRGDKVAKVAVAVAPDPLTFCASSTKMAGYKEDELEFVGGLRGSPLPVVRCETCDIRVPAHAEFIIEGEVPLDEFEEEGPYGEMYGYQGPKKDSNFFMNITAVTHRRDPWVLNSFTGLTWDMPKAPQVASNFFRYKRMIPNLTGFYTPGGANGVVVISIDKRFPGQGMSAGQHVAANPALNKVVIVVDDDVDIMNPGVVLKTLGARWQPSASVMIPQTQMMMPDPSRPVPMLSSKIVIDATRQFPQEGGPKKWPAANRELLVQGAPGVMEYVDANWNRYFRNWKRNRSGAMSGLKKIREALDSRLERWDAKLDALEAQLSVSSEQARERLHDAKEKLSFLAGVIEEKLEDVADLTEDEVEVLKRDLEELRVQLALARAEGRDAFQAQRKQLEKAMHDAEARLGELEERLAASAGDEIESFVRLADRLNAELEAAEVQFALLRAEERDALEKVRNKLSHRLAELRADLKLQSRHAAEHLDEFEERMRNGFAEFRESLSKLVSGRQG